MAAHVDVRVIVRADPEVVWRHAINPAAWGAAGHPVQNLAGTGDVSTFSVTTPPDERGRSWHYQVERVVDEPSRTVYSRRFGGDFRYGHVWYAYTPAPAGTEMRCVVDFELTAGAGITDEEMADVMARAMQKNMTATARQIETKQKEESDDGRGD
jgi:hypothetical protein